jgi:hypothetical protein
VEKLSIFLFVRVVSQDCIAWRSGWVFLDDWHDYGMDEANELSGLHLLGRECVVKV